MHNENPVCKAYRAADETRTDVLNFAHHHAKPYLNRAQTRIEPYASKVRPHYSRASSFAQPHFSRAHRAYHSLLHPHILSGHRQAQAAAEPYLQQARSYHAKNVDPQIKHYQRLGRKLYSDNLEPHVERGRAFAQPHLDHAQNVLAPAASKYYSDVAMPYASSSYHTTRKAYVRDVHPRLTDIWSRMIAFLRTHVFPIFGRWHAVYIRPQVDRVMQKIFEAKTKKASMEAIVEAEAKERRLSAEDGTDDLDGASVYLMLTVADSTARTAFIEELREEITEPTEDGAPIGEGKEAIQVEREREGKLQQATSEARLKLEAERDRYEGEIEQLAKTERILLIERLNSIRAAASRDIPARFDPRVRDLKVEAAKLLGKLEKYFERGVLGP